MAASTSLTVKILSDATDAVGGLDKTSSGLDDLGRSADKTADKLKASGRGIDDVASSADDMEGKAAKATGALGALSSGFELVGMTGAADALNSAAMATDFVSGAMDSFTLLTELNTVAAIKNKAATVASTVATKAQQVATIAGAAAQRLFNTAMSMNPIGLVIIAVTLLVAAFVILYKKSETFRDLIAQVGVVGKLALDGIKIAVGWVIDKVQDAVTWFGKLKVPQAVQDAVDHLKNGMDKVVGWIGDAVTGFGKLKVPQAVQDAVDTLKTGMEKVVGWIQDAITALGKLKFPSPPGWLTKLIPGGNSASGSVAPTVAPTATTTAVAPTVTNIFNITGAVDPEAVARQIGRIQSRHAIRVGLAT